MAQNNTRELHSIIKKYFSNEIYLGILKIIKIPAASNNEKGILIKNYLRENGIPFSPLGTGTNRIGIQIEGYAVKIALDEDGMIDNRREMLYSKVLQPYVVKVYECTPSGLLAVSEYVTYFNMEDYTRYKSEMYEILSDISNNFLIGDCGITTKNFANWGKRRSDNSICILDFAYIYDVKFNVFTCSCDDTTYLQYDDNFVNLICPKCNKKYTFGNIRKRITRKAQEEEIGDIRRLSYNIKEDREHVPVIQEFEPEDMSKKKKDKKVSPYELLIKEYKRKKREEKYSGKDYWDVE